MSNPRLSQRPTVGPHQASLVGNEASSSDDGINRQISQHGPTRGVNGVHLVNAESTGEGNENPRNDVNRMEEEVPPAPLVQEAPPRRPNPRQRRQPHRHPRPIEPPPEQRVPVGQNPDNVGQPVAVQAPPAPPGPPQLPDALDMVDIDFNPINKILDFESISIGKCAVYLMICCWILLFTTFQNNWESYASGIICSLLVILAVRRLLTKPEILNNFHYLTTFQTRIIQMMVLSWLCMGMVIALDGLGQHPSGIFPTNAKIARVFKTTWKNSPDSKWGFIFDNWTLWILTNYYFLVVSFSFLLLIEVPLVLHQMSRNSELAKQILIFEMKAHVHPLVYLTTPFWIMDLIGFLVPREYQSLWMWGIIHLIMLPWLVIVICGVIQYPDIPLARPMGLPGYLFMTTATIMQILAGMLLYQFVELGRNVYFQLYPGGLQAALQNPGVVFGPQLYLSQLKQPPETWKHLFLYPFSFEFLEGVLFFIHVCRFFKLTSFIGSIEERLVND